MKVRSNASFFEAAAVAIDSLRGSKLRSFLTLLGIILSTTTLIAVMSIFSGMDVYIANTASSMGSDGFRVLKMAFVGNFDPKKFLEMQRKNPTLLPEEFEMLKPRLTLVKEAGMTAGRGGKVGYSGDIIDVGLNAGTPNVATMSGYEVDLGRFFTDTEDERHLEVIFLGADVKDRFFPNTDPIGKTVTLDGRPFTVVGTSKAKGSVWFATHEEVARFAKANAA